ncbi:MAG TPA: hypothetical protein VH478_15460 [Trebonia sp.]|nr:hypothetical protein [Trebonia sp.]
MKLTPCPAWTSTADGIVALQAPNGKPSWLLPPLEPTKLAGLNSVAQDVSGKITSAWISPSCPG